MKHLAKNERKLHPLMILQAKEASVSNLIERAVAEEKQREAKAMRQQAFTISLISS